MQKPFQINPTVLEALQAAEKRILEKKLKEHKIDLNLNEEVHKKFKALRSEKIENKKTIYYNDGSINGLRIVTFVYTAENFSLDEFIKSITLRYKLDYY